MQSDTTGSLQEFHKILEEAGKKGASDIHYVPKEQLLLRIDGRLVDMTEEWNVSFSMEELIEKLLDKKQQKTFEENGEVEFSCPVFNKRVRVNLFRQSGTCAMSVCLQRRSRHRRCLVFRSRQCRWLGREEGSFL